MALRRLTRLSTITGRTLRTHTSFAIKPPCLASFTHKPMLSRPTFKHSNHNRPTHFCRSLSTPTQFPTAKGGFSYPGPRKLSEIVKLQLLQKHPPSRVREIWSEYHADHTSAVGDVLSADEFALLKHRSARCRHFVLPVPR